MNSDEENFFVLVRFLILPVLVFAETYWGGELPDISNTQLKAEVSVTGDVYTYSYTIISGSSNTGQIWSFDVDIKQPEGGIELSGEGLVNGSGYRRHSAAQVLSEPTTPKMIPVGLWSPPNWNSGLSVTGNAGWGADDDQDMIMPGQTLSGLRMNSRGLPGIKNFQIDPDIVPPPSGDTTESVREWENFLGLTEEEMDKLTEDESNDMVNKKVDDIEGKVAFTGKTLGPTAPPADFKPLAFIDAIISLKHEAVALGWIKNQGIINSLDVKLENAKKAIEKNNIRPAKKHARSLYKRG